MQVIRFSKTQPKNWFFLRKRTMYGSGRLDNSLFSVTYLRVKPVIELCFYAITTLTRYALSNTRYSIVIIGRCRWTLLSQYLGHSYCGKELRKEKHKNSLKGCIEMTHVKRTVDRPSKGDEEEALSLSARQLQILHLIAQGYTNVQIADELELSKHTVDAYCRRILLKFKTSSRVTAAVKASQLGLISDV